MSGLQQQLCANSGRFDSGSTSNNVATSYQPRSCREEDDFVRLPELVEKYLQGYRMGARPHAGSHGPRRAKRTND